MWNDNDDRIIHLLSLTEDNITFPWKCPICGKQSGHVYMHRHNENHGGIWTWCSNCHNFTHLSGIIPRWWENYEYLDENKLSSTPEYLDQNAEKIDEWINALSKKSERESAIDLKVIGVYNEMPYGKASDLSIKDYLNQEDDDNISKICGYLDQGIVIIKSTEPLSDVIDSSKGNAGMATALTDGEWLWPGDISYYVRNYRLKLPNEFLETMIRNDWKVPTSAADIDHINISINGIRLK